MFKYHLFFILVILSCVSCAELEHIDQALALKAYSSEKDAQAAAVARSDALFERLLDNVKSGNARRSLDTAIKLVSQYGEPLLKKPLDHENGAEEWLYRHQIQSASSSKIYVIVSGNGDIQGFRYEQ